MPTTNLPSRSISPTALRGSASGDRPISTARASGSTATLARAVLIGRSPLALPRKAVGEIDRDGKFVVGTLLPGRYEISIRVGSRILQITAGPREVEIPIDPGATVDLADAITVRPQAEE